MVDTGFSRAIATYQPQIGDVVIWHGWLLSRWFGFITDINKDGNLTIISAGLPVLLFAAGKKKKYEVDLESIQASVGGEYAVQRAEKNMIVWYI